MKLLPTSRFWFWVILPSLFLPMTISNADTLNVGSNKQLFIDDLFFDSKENITLQIHPPRKTGEKNLDRTKPWESATLNWFTVREDNGKYRMWYEAYDVNGWPSIDDTSFCYAESEDGIHWTKPALNLVEYEGQKDTNILFRLVGPEGAKSRVHGTCVFIDPNAPAAERYKGVSQGWFGQNISAGVRGRNFIAGMVSPDGLHWTRLAKPIAESPSDSQYSGFWDSDRKEYAIYGRVPGKEAGRAIGRSASKQFQSFKPLEMILDGDTKRFPDCGLYNPAAMKYPDTNNVYLMFPSLFNRKTQKLDIFLAVSRDGITWTWPSTTVPFIPLGEKDSFDSGSVYMGQGYIIKGNEIWQYYGGSNLDHAEGELENLIKPGGSRICSRVISRLDGYMSVSADEKGGWFVTPPLTYTGNTLSLNVSCREGGSVRVALLDQKGKEIEHRSIEDCRPIQGDGTSIMVYWKSDGDLSQTKDKPVRLKFQLVNADIYSFQFGEGYPYILK